MSCGGTMPCVFTMPYGVPCTMPHHAMPDTMPCKIDSMATLCGLRLVLAAALIRERILACALAAAACWPSVVIAHLALVGFGDLQRALQSSRNANPWPLVVVDAA